MDYYKVLGVEKNASDNTIKQAYKSLAKKHHPDLGGDENMFKQISEAYDTLKNPETRRQYDHIQSGPSNPFTGDPFAGGRPGGFSFHTREMNVEDILREMEEQMQRGEGRPDFGDLYRNQRRQQKNRNLNLTLNMTLEDLISTGETVEKHLSVRMSDGSRDIVKLNIPPHIQTGETIKFPGLGDNANKSLTRGDLFVTILIQNHPTYEKKGLDLYTTLTIDSLDAILGCDKIIQTLSGKSLKLRIPAGTSYGKIFNMRSEGLRFRDKTGNILVQLVISTPQNLTEKQLDFIRKAKAENNEND